MCNIARRDLRAQAPRPCWPKTFARTGREYRPNPADLRIAVLPLAIGVGPEAPLIDGGPPRPSAMLLIILAIKGGPTWKSCFALKVSVSRTTEFHAHPTD